VLRGHWGTIGLATASSISITVYVLLLGFLQRRRFEREAAKRGASLHGEPGMLDAALRLAAAAGIATCIGLAVRAALLQLLPGTSRRSSCAPPRCVRSAVALISFWRGSLASANW
jgi:putative peptidoglycan lipid II flippase